MQRPTEPRNGTALRGDLGAVLEADELDQQRAAVAQAERAVLAQRAELVRMMGELRQLQEAVRVKQSPELEALRAENDKLARQLAERERERDLVIEALREREDELKALSDAEAEPRPDGESEARLAQLQQENELLRQLLGEKDALLEEIRKRPEPAEKPKATMDDLERYEAELLEFRRQVETDRAKLAQEIQLLRTRNQELDEATREMEMEMSRERAELARERTRLDRLRDEVRDEMERFSRDGSVWDRLAPVQRLREQLNEPKAPGPKN